MSPDAQTKLKREVGHLIRVMNGQQDNKTPRLEQHIKQLNDETVVGLIFFESRVDKEGSDLQQ
jgi:hypothetical protein